MFVWQILNLALIENTKKHKLFTPLKPLKAINKQQEIQTQLPFVKPESSVPSKNHSAQPQMINFLLQTKSVVFWFLFLVFFFYSMKCFDESYLSRF